jgi:peptidoglycan DL-endopeptidase CwlO
LNNHKGKLLAGTVVMLFLASFSSVYANQLSEKRSQARQLESAVNRAEQQIQKDKQQEQLFQKQVDSYNASLNAINKSLVENQREYQSLLSRVNALEKKIGQTESNLKAAQNQLAQDLRFTYENGNVSYLEVLFQAQSFSDFLSRFEELAMIAQNQHQTVEGFKTLKSELSKQRKSLDQEKTSLQKRHAQLAQLQFVNLTLKEQKAKALQNAVLRERRDRNVKYTLESQLKLTQAQIQQIIAETQYAEQRVQDPTYIQKTESSFAKVNANDLIRYAEQFIGLPYVWGGTSPNPGFDCSGFTQYVYAHFGVQLPRTSQEQFAQGIAVSRSELQPGDLVFFSTYAPGATHVGIYIGNGMMINSEDAGLQITSMSLSYWSSRYIGARRVMNTN